MNNRKCYITAVLALLVGLDGGYWISELQRPDDIPREIILKDMLNSSFVALHESNQFADIVEMLHSSKTLKDDKTLRERLRIGVNGSIKGDAIIKEANSKGVRFIVMSEDERSRLKDAKVTLDAYDKPAEQIMDVNRP
jgi:hypothetical protein